MIRSTGSKTLRRTVAIALVAVGLTVSACTGSTSTTTESTEGGEVSGSIQSKGSDTMVNLANRWAEEFMKANPGVNIAVTGGGSGTGIAALLNGTTDLANASRPIKDEEKEDGAKAGIDVTEHVVAIDGIAVALNKANKVDELTYEQLSGIYAGEITDWKDVGGEPGKIVVLSRESNSGTHVYFLEEVVQYDGDEERAYAQSALLMPSTQAIVEEVAKNPAAIGYIGMGYLSDDIKAVKVAKEAGDEAVAPEMAAVQSGTYPISRNLYIYTAGQPEGADKAFLDWIVSEDGQKIVEEMDFVPLKS